MKIELYRLETGGFKRYFTTHKAGSVSYSATLSDVGEFEFDIAAGAIGREMLPVSAVVHINGGFWGVILKNKLDINGVNAVINIGGIDLKSYVSGLRSVVPDDYTTVDGTAGYDDFAGSTEAVIKYFWNKNLVETVNPDRAMNYIAIAENLDRGIADDKLMARGGNLAEITKELCDNAKIGYSAEIADGSVVLDVFAGVDRTAGQNVNPRAIFEIKRGNILSLELDDDIGDYKNTFYTTRSGYDFVDETLTMTYFEDDEPKTGWDRQEVWLDVSVNTPVAGDEYNEMKYQAVKKMEPYKVKTGFMCKITDKIGLKFGENWNIGDTVTVRHGNTVLDTQVTAVNITAEGAALDISAKFGNQKPRYVAAGEKKIIKI